jgi:methyl-accepting chemotaxis protein
MKLGHKLLSGFFVVATVPLLASIAAFVTMRRLASNTEKIYRGTSVPLSKLTLLSTNAQLNRVYLRNLLDAQNVGEVDAALAKINEMAAKNTLAAEEFEKSLVSDQGRQAFRNFKTVRDQQRSLRARIIGLKREGKVSEAMAILQGDYAEAARAQQRATEQLLDYAIVLGAELNQNSAEAAAASSKVVIVTTILVALLAVGISFGFSRSITKPVGHVVHVLEQVARGDLTRRVKIDSKDEIGQMGQALNDTLDGLTASMATIGGSSAELASSSRALTAISQQMSANAEETSTQSDVVSAAAEQVTKNFQTVATATEEMTSSIKEIAKNANESAKVATSAVKTAETTNLTVAKLGESSAEIGQVIKVITSIAQQTNLLALNAAIEAARAGEAGKGFAVVANEVKELAKETAKATEDISRKIEAIQGDTKGAVEAIAQITGVINEINDISSTIASAVEEQTATTNEIARNVQEGANGGSQVAENVASVAQAAKSTTQCASDTQRAAGELARMAAELQKVVGQFKYDGSERASGATEFRSTAKEARDAHLAGRVKTQPGMTTRVH